LALIIEAQNISLGQSTGPQEVGSKGDVTLVERISPGIQLGARLDFQALIDMDHYSPSFLGDQNRVSFHLEFSD
ncbi:MAG: hypothetical protein ACQEP8_05155, partial [Chlamydiota bacterium]